MRTVIEGPGFANQKARIHPDPIIFDDIFEGVIFALSRQPQMGVHALGPLFALPLSRWQPRGIPAFTLFYMFDKHTVTLVGLLREDELA